MPPSIHDKSKTCFVFPDGDGGYVVTMNMPDGKPLQFDLNLQRAAHLQEGLSRAISDLAKKSVPRDE